MTLGLRRILVLLAGLLGAAGLVWRARLPPRVAQVMVDPEPGTVLDASGAVRSVQAADLTLSTAKLDAIWTPMHLERLARTYWRFLTRVTLGLIRVAYTPAERYVVLIARPLVLLSFAAPEYELSPQRGTVRWRIASGILVSPRGRGGDGYLQIDVQRFPAPRPDHVRCHVEVEVANFYPAIASGISTWAYKATQSRIHVIVTHGFLRSLARLDLAPSKVGRFAQVLNQTPAPTKAPPGSSERPAA